MQLFMVFNATAKNTLFRSVIETKCAYIQGWDEFM